MKRATVLFIIAVLMLAVLVSCGSEEENNSGHVEYDTTVTVDEIASKVNEKLSVELIEADSDYVANFYSDIDFTCVDSYKIYFSASSVDQYGVFKAKNENEANMLIASVSGFVEKVGSTWMTEYDPADTVKIENSAAFSKGVYVVFSFLSSDDSNALLEALDSSVKAVG